MRLLLLILGLLSVGSVAYGAEVKSLMVSMDAIITAIKGDRHDIVQEMASASWLARFRAAGFSSLSDIPSGIMEAESIGIEYSEIIRAEGVEYGLIFCSVVTMGERPFRYKTAMLWAKEPQGWRYLNLPFKDFTLPIGLAISMRP